MITPEQFNKLVTKDDIKSLIEDVAGTKTDVRKIMTTLDSINKTLGIHEDERVANVASHDRMQTTLDNHEKRITKIEKVPVAA